MTPRLKLIADIATAIETVIINNDEYTKDDLRAVLKFIVDDLEREPSDKETNDKDEIDDFYKTK